MSSFRITSDAPGETNIERYIVTYDPYDEGGASIIFIGTLKAAERYVNDQSRKRGRGGLIHVHASVQKWMSEVK